MRRGGHSVARTSPDRVLAHELDRFRRRFWDPNCVFINSERLSPNVCTPRVQLDRWVYGYRPAQDLESAAVLLASLKDLWAHPATTAEDRAAICRRLFAQIVYDTDAQAVKAIHLRGELAPLFAVLPAEVYTRSGSDGIRTRGLLRDRQAC